MQAADSAVPIQTGSQTVGRATVLVTYAINQ